jgi:hypothetical protein
MQVLFSLLKTKRNQSVPRSKHSTTVIKTNQLMTYKAKVAVCSDIRKKHSTQSERHVECLNVNSLRTKLYLSNLKTQFVPRSKHSLRRL